MRVGEKRHYVSLEVEHREGEKANMQFENFIFRLLPLQKTRYSFFLLYTRFFGLGTRLFKLDTRFFNSILAFSVSILATERNETLPTSSVVTGGSAHHYTNIDATSCVSWIACMHKVYLKLYFYWARHAVSK